MAQVNNPEVFRRIAIYCGISEPSGHLKLEYLAEGAANVIFTVHFTGPDLERYSNLVVLRLRKDLAFTVPVTQALHEFEDRIAPLFVDAPSLILPPTSFELSQDTVSILNEELHRLESTGERHEKRRLVYLPPFSQEPYAILLPNLHSRAGQVVEFKPKWLIQSPSAPTEAQRCRTCALNTMRRQKNMAKGRGDSGLCPFDLLSSNQEILQNALLSLWHDEGTLFLFTTEFRTRVQPALRLLQDLQRQHNGVGLDDFTQPEGKDFSVAMALRDCSVFLKVSVSSDRLSVGIDLLKILDLDLKDAGGGKLAKWADDERTLIREGWYTMTQAQHTTGSPCAVSFR